MSTSDEVVLDGTPWALAVDEEAGELHIEHDESGHSYVFDDEGNLHVPGDGDIDGPLHEVRDALAGALADSHDDQQLPADEECTVACDQDTGELRLQSTERITLDAPAIDVNADENLIATAGTVDVNTDEELNATAGTVEVNADGELNATAGTVEVDANEALNATAGSVDVQATDVALTGTDQTTVRSNRNLELSANTELTLDGNSRLTIEGSIIEASARGRMNLSATGPMTIEGALINLN